MMNRRELLASVIAAPLMKFVPEKKQAYGWVSMEEGMRAWAESASRVTGYPLQIGHWSNTLLVISE